MEDCPVLANLNKFSIKDQRRDNANNLLWLFLFSSCYYFLLIFRRFQGRKSTEKIEATQETVEATHYSPTTSGPPSTTAITRTNPAPTLSIDLLKNTEFRNEKLKDLTESHLEFLQKVYDIVSKVY